MIGDIERASTAIERIEIELSKLDPGFDIANANYRLVTRLENCADKLEELNRNENS